MRAVPSRCIRRPGFIFVAFFAAFFLVASAGCADNAPVAAPTSTLPEKQPDGNSTGDAAEVDIPDYETDLDLSAEEEEAVNGALVAFDSFIQTINRAYSGEPNVAEKFPEVASGEALDSIRAEADAISSKSASFEGAIIPLKVEIYELGDTNDQAGVSSVKVNFCVDTTQWALTKSGNSPTQNPDGKVTMQHTIRLSNDRWRVDQQNLWERSC